MATFVNKKWEIKNRGTTDIILGPSRLVAHNESRERSPSKAMPWLTSGAAASLPPRSAAATQRRTAAPGRGRGSRA